MDSTWTSRNRGPQPQIRSLLFKIPIFILSKIKLIYECIISYFRNWLPLKKIKVFYTFKRLCLMYNEFVWEQIHGFKENEYTVLNLRSISSLKRIYWRYENTVFTELRGTHDSYLHFSKIDINKLKTKRVAFFDFWKL